MSAAESMVQQGGTPPARTVPAAVAEVWVRARPTILARIGALEDAVASLRAGPLTDEQRREAERAAHRLTGSLGTFGFPEASDHARELEQFFASGDVSTTLLPRVSAAVAALRSSVDEGAEQTPVAAAPEVDVADGASVLIIGLEEPCAEEVAAVVERRGLRVRVAASSAVAQDAILRQLPDIVVTSLEGEAEEHFTLLEELSRRDSSVQAVVLTPGGAFVDRVRAVRAGVRSFLSTPVTPAKLADVVMDVHERTARRQPTVLLVDDDPAVHLLVPALLEPAGLRTVALGEPERFWETLQDTSPDLVALDLDMPGISGLDLCRVIRSDPRWSATPVLFLTGSEDADAVQRVFDAGADDFVRKPIIGPELVTRIANRLERARLHRALADTDPLTGLANRRRAEEELGRFISLGARHEQPVAVGLLDLDRFKHVNDTHGHAAGDEVLRRLANLLRGAFRGDDVVARWGGEELLVAMYGMSRHDGVQRIAEVLESFRHERFAAGDGGEFACSFSAGLAQYPIDGHDLAGLYRTADLALYEAKAAGRDRVVAAGWQRDDVTLTDVAVVEDDPVMAGLLTGALDTRGYRSSWLADGEAAMARLAGASPALRARVVVLDVDLPGVDGLTILRGMADAGTLIDTRVVMLTARSAESEVLRALELGAFDHVAKPFSVPVLLQRIRRAFESSG